MSAESDLYSLLSTDAGLAAQVGARIYPDLVPENVAVPYVGFERVAGTPLTAMSGARMGELAGFTLACWAETRIEAESLANTVVTALAASPFTHLARGAEVDEQTGRLATTLDYQILTD